MNPNEIPGSNGQPERDGAPEAIPSGEHVETQRKALDIITIISNRVISGYKESLQQRRQHSMRREAVIQNRNSQLRLTEVYDNVPDIVADMLMNRIMDILQETIEHCYPRLSLTEQDAMRTEIFSQVSHPLVERVLRDFVQSEKKYITLCPHFVFQTIDAAFPEPPFRKPDDAPRAIALFFNNFMAYFTGVILRQTARQQYCMRVGDLAAAIAASKSGLDRNIATPSALIEYLVRKSIMVDGMIEEHSIDPKGDETSVSLDIHFFKHEILGNLHQLVLGTSIFNRSIQKYQSDGQD